MAPTQKEEPDRSRSRSHSQRSSHIPAPPPRTAAQCYSLHTRPESHCRSLRTETGNTSRRCFHRGVDLSQATDYSYFYSDVDVAMSRFYDDLCNNQVNQNLNDMMQLADYNLDFTEKHKDFFMTTEGIRYYLCRGPDIHHSHHTCSHRPVQSHQRLGD